MQDWIKEGAPVVVVYHYAAQPPTAKKSTITRVTKTTFTVDSVEQRFNLERRRTTDSGGWANTYYEALVTTEDYAALCDCRCNLLPGTHQAGHCAQAKAAKAVSR